jgi:hypothetical protein
MRNNPHCVSPLLGMRPPKKGGTMLHSLPSRPAGCNGEPAVLERPQNTLERFATLASGGPLLMMTARFGRSRVRDAAYRLRDRRRELDLRPSWRLFASLVDWAERWPAEQVNYAAGLILSAAGDPVVERAVGRCLADLYQLGRPLLWGVVSDRVRWHPRFKLGWNGWPVERFPYPIDTYARLCVAHDSAEFCPQFDPILYTADPDFFVRDGRLYWRDPCNFFVVTRRG